MQHDLSCPFQGGGHSDAARRVSDTYNLHLSALGQDAIGQWIAVRLSDGDSDGELYASRRDAVRHQKHDENWYAFVRICPSSMSVCEASAMLRASRAAYDAGMRLADPDHRAGGREVIPRLTSEDQRSQVASLLTRGRLAPSNLIIPRV